MLVINYESQPSVIIRSLRCKPLTSNAITQATIKPTRLGVFGLPEFATLQQKQLVYVEILQSRAKFQNLIVSCSGFNINHKFQWPLECLNC